MVVFGDCLCCFNNIKRVDACYRTNTPKTSLIGVESFERVQEAKKSGFPKEAGLILWSIGESNS